MKITVIKANNADLERAKNLFNLYVLEISEIIGSAYDLLNNAELCEKLCNVYWTEEDHFPFLIFCGEELAGFALVRRYPLDKELYDMGQFFILDKFKGKGIGRKAFNLTLNNFPGKWLVRVLFENDRAFNFWRNVVSEKTGGNYLVSKELDEGLNMYFIRYTSLRDSQ